MNNIEEAENIIALLKNVLEFYANKENYNNSVNINNVLNSLIELDQGLQARFGLDKIREFEKADDLVKNITIAVENNESSENIIKIIEEFKKFNDANNDI